MTSIKKKRAYKPILCLDFDGVLHWYRNGWKGAAIIDDEPTPGSVEFVTNAKGFFKVVVFSSRSNQPGGIDAMRTWMNKNGFPEVEFVNEKPKAFLTIDDRAIQFSGTWFDPQELLKFKPWNKSD
ncbi:MAG: hypothetical protein ACYDH1_01665 [Anaerolineaceae bacterium]